LVKVTPVSAVKGLQGGDVEHHVALRRGAVPRRRGAGGVGAQIARVGHHREFVVVVLRIERAVIAGIVTVLEAKGVTKLVHDGVEGVGSVIFVGRVAIAAEKQISGSAATKIGVEAPRRCANLRVDIAGLNDANRGGAGETGGGRHEGQVRVGGHQVE
jgi:hypothetical protein